MEKVEIVKGGKPYVFLDAPTSPGWWLRWHVWGKKYEVLELSDDPNWGLRPTAGGTPVSQMDNYLWYGPIEPPRVG